jgi:hypothetical protein
MENLTLISQVLVGSHLLHFCPNNSRFMLDYNSQNAFHLEMFKVHFLEHSHTCENVLKSWDILPTCILQTWLWAHNKDHDQCWYGIYGFNAYVLEYVESKLIGIIL